MSESPNSEHPKQNRKAMLLSTSFPRARQGPPKVLEVLNRLGFLGERWEHDHIWNSNLWQYNIVYDNLGKFINLIKHSNDWSLLFKQAHCKSMAFRIFPTIFRYWGHRTGCKTSKSKRAKAWHHVAFHALDISKILEVEQFSGSLSLRTPNLFLLTEWFQICGFLWKTRGDYRRFYCRTSKFDDSLSLFLLSQ
jgi:hypothetical protein